MDEEVKKMLEAIKTATAEEKAVFRAALGIDDDADRGSSQNNIAREEELKTLQKIAELTGDITKMEKLRFQAIEQELLNALDAAKAAGEATAKEVEQANLAIDEFKRTGEAIGNLDMGGPINNLVEQFEKVGKVQRLVEKTSSEAGRESERMADSLGKMIGISTKFADTTVGKMTSLFGKMAADTDEARGLAIKFGQDIAKAFSPQNIGASVFTQIFSESVKLLRAFDEANASLVKSTGTSGKFTKVLYDTQRASNLLGVDMAKAGAAIATLNAETSAFAKMSQSLQTSIAIAATEFDRLGISAQDTSKFMENALKIMNMGGTEAIQVQKELAMAGVEVGIGAEKIVKDFNAASKTLAVYGKQSIDVFKGVAAQAKAAGVEVGTLLGIVKQFDTFSGAAEGAAKFNALLGTQLSTTQMLMMNEEERMKTLIESVQAQGVMFGDMDKYTQLSIAAAAGITDMNEANRIFGMSVADYEANKRVMNENADATAKFEDAIKKTVPVFTQFKNLATELITLVQPALEFLGKIADKLTTFFRGLSPEAKETASAIALFAAGIATLVPLFAVGGGFMAGLAAVGPAIAGIGIGVAKGLTAISSAVALSGGLAGGILAGLLVGGSVIGGIMASMAESEAKIAASNAQMVSKGGETIQAMADIGKADFSGIATKFKGVIDELGSMGSDVKVTSTLQNLALMSAGTAFDLTGAKIAASSTNVTANVQNVFDGMKMTLEAGGKEFEAYVKNVAAQTVLT